MWKEFQQSFFVSVNLCTNGWFFFFLLLLRSGSPPACNAVCPDVVAVSPRTKSNCGEKTEHGSVCIYLFFFSYKHFSSVSDSNGWLYKILQFQFFGFVFRWCFMLGRLYKSNYFKIYMYWWYMVTVIYTFSK